MGINTKISKIPFFVLYIILAAFTSFNWIRVILFQNNFEVFQNQQPWDYYLSDFFVNTFGITQRQYYIFTFPVILIGLYIIPKIIGKLMSLDKKSNVKGDNHIAVIAILLIAPVSLGLHKLINLGWRSYLIPGVVLISLFSIWSWLDEKNNR